VSIADREKLMIDIFQLLEERGAEAFSLTETIGNLQETKDPNSNFSRTHSVCVNTFLGFVFKQEIKDFATKKGFVIEEKDGQIVFFKTINPKQP
jgi:hypothetical protein